MNFFVDEALLSAYVRYARGGVYIYNKIRCFLTSSLILFAIYNYIVIDEVVVFEK